MKCKNCNLKNATKYSQYSTGEFCSKECSRSFSTKNKRIEINKQVSKKLSGRNLSAQTIEKLKGEKNGMYNHNISQEERERRNNKKKRTKQPDVTNVCPNCNIDFIIPYKQRRQICCSKSCTVKLRHKCPEYINKCREWGKKSAISQNKRSKNEIYFGELCKNKFNSVKFNEPIFNGWDADIIIEDLKLAVLWNGKWHYEKITEKHSVKQVQNRDKIKLSEISKCGYDYLVIKDMGKWNKKFVEGQFKDLISKDSI